MLDTHSVARQLQDVAIHRMTGAERLQLACEMSDLTRELAKTRIRQEHPDWNAGRLLAALVRTTVPPAAVPPQFR
jgi:hypothetical protein